MFIAWFLYWLQESHISKLRVSYPTLQDRMSQATNLKASLGEGFSFSCAENYLDSHSLFRQSYKTISPGTYQHCLTSMSPRLSAPALSKVLTGYNEKLMARGVVTRCFACNISKNVSGILILLKKKKKKFKSHSRSWQT